MNTIAAISTAPGIGGIGIVRISGEDAFKVLEKIFIPKNKEKISNIKGYTIKYGHIFDGTEIVDEVLVSYFKNPKSYTKEDMCEINTHGGVVVLNKILDLCLEKGAELAEPGEFTKRAFLNGRLDLSQAEAVIDIINSKTDREAEVSVKQLNGNVSYKIKEIKKDILSILADIEASIDYPEYDIEEVTNTKILNFLNEIDIKLESLEKGFENGKLIKEGVKVVILGRPNAGKSSLLNLILDEERAIVTNIEGTTRDTIEEFVTIKGIPFKIIDTAGIRNSNDEIEKIGVNKALNLAKQSDVIIGIFDINKKLSKDDYKIIDVLKNNKSLIILNKNDLEIKIEKDVLKKLNIPMVEMSTFNHDDLEKVYSILEQMFKINEISYDNDTIITNERHKNAIRKSRKFVNNAIKTIKNNMPIDIISSDMKQILEELGKITGDTVTEDIINEIFSKFCLGK